MCEALLELMKDELDAARAEGIEKGIDQGIRGTVSVLKELNIPAQTILAKIQEQYHLSPETSRKYL